jgi:hypothetical protein
MKAKALQLRCQALDMDGRRCRRKAVKQEEYHGDAEIYGYPSPRPQWVKVWFCEQHAKSGAQS